MLLPKSSTLHSDPNRHKMSIQAALATSLKLSGMSTENQAQRLQSSL